MGDSQLEFRPTVSIEENFTSVPSKIVLQRRACPISKPSGANSLMAFAPNTEADRESGGRCATDRSAKRASLYPARPRG